MGDAEQLTYYEYWLAKRYWNAEVAIYMLFDYVKHKKGWEPSDDYMSVMKAFIDKAKVDMAGEDARQIFGMLATNVEGWDDLTDRWIETGVDLEESQLKPKEFLEWAYKKGYELPYEFKEFIGAEEPDPLMNKMSQKREFAIDKATCQSVARTLWDEYPKTTIDEMQEHRAIQIYGGGKGYSTETTLRRWLREVDPRTSKTGKKKL